MATYTFTSITGGKTKFSSTVDINGGNQTADHVTMAVRGNVVAFSSYKANGTPIEDYLINRTTDTVVIDGVSRAANYFSTADLLLDALNILFPNANSSSGGSSAFSAITGAYTDNASLVTGFATKANALTPTAEKTGSYTLAAGDFVPGDTTGGSIVFALPTAPADKTICAVKMVKQTGTNTITINTGGSDVYNKASGSTAATIALLNQGYYFQYKATGAIWYVLADDLPLSQLDLRFANLASPALTGTPTAPTAAVSTSTTQIASTAFVQAALPVKNTSAELNTGTDDAKFSTSLGLASSKYITQNGAKIYAVASGTDTYTITLSPAITAWVTGMSFNILFTNTNTGASTVNPNGVGSAPLKKAGVAALEAGDIVAGTIYHGVYDGTNMQLDIGVIGKWYDWVPTYTGFSVNPPVSVSRYTLIGKLCVGYIHHITSNGTSNSTSTTVTFPFSCTNQQAGLVTITVDGGVQGTVPGKWIIAAGSNIVTLYRDVSNTLWSNSAGKRFQLAFSYEIA